LLFSPICLSWQFAFVMASNPGWRIVPRPLTVVRSFPVERSNVGAIVLFTFSGGLLSCLLLRGEFCRALNGGCSNTEKIDKRALVTIFMALIFFSLSFLLLLSK